jgi:hypothetical protein
MTTPYEIADCLWPHMIINAGRKLLLFPSTATRTDGMSPFQAMEGRNIDCKKDVGPPFGSYCEVDVRVMTNGLNPRTRSCLYLDSKMNGTGTHTFMTLDTQQLIAANHYVVLPITDIIIQTVNSWAKKNKNPTSREPVFTFHNCDITHEADDDNFEQVTVAAPSEALVEPQPLPPVFRPDSDAVAPPSESPRIPEPSQIGGGMETTAATDDIGPTLDEVTSLEEPPEIVEDPIPEIEDTPPANVRTRPAKAPIEMREKSTRIKRAPVRFDLGAIQEPLATPQEARRAPTALMSVQRGLKLFRTETEKAIELEVASLLINTTFLKVNADIAPHNTRKRTLRSIMNVVEKYLPTLDSEGN